MLVRTPPKRKTKEKAEFGDFQTPPALAYQVCRVLGHQGLEPAAIVEPSCGTGSFLVAGFAQFRTVTKALGVELSASYVRAARAELRRQSCARSARIVHADFFDTDWPALLQGLPDPLLVLGNPPWVTNAQLGSLGSSNLPQKTNFQRRSGLDAITGKSNFDISEWMLIHLLEWLDGREATLAMLCKTAVARKTLLHAWNKRLHLRSSAVHPIDASAVFGASVDACLLICRLSPCFRNVESSVHDRLGSGKQVQVLGYRDGHLVADVSAYERWKHLAGEGPYRWRSGIKHDCTKVMELVKEGP